MARDLYGMGDKLATLGGATRSAGAAPRASLVSWMTPGATPLVALAATLLILAPELFIAGSLRIVAFGAGAVTAWATLVAIVFWMVLHTVRDRILLGCLVAGAMTATVGTLTPVGSGGLAVRLLVGAVLATMGAVFAVGVMTHQSRLNGRGRLFLGAVVLACTLLTHVAAITTDVSPFQSAGLLVVLFGLHAVAVTAMLSTLEDRLQNAPWLGAATLLAMVLGAIWGLSCPREVAARTPLSSIAADTAERARSGLRDRVRSAIGEPSARELADRSTPTAVEPESGDLTTTDAERPVSAPTTNTVEDGWSAIRRAHRQGDRRFDHAVMRSLCDPRADRLAEVLASWNARPSTSRGDVIRHLRAWLACGHDALLAGENPKQIVEIARATSTDEATRLALDLARHLPAGHAVGGAAMSLAAQRLRRMELQEGRSLADKLALAAEAVERGAMADAAPVLEGLGDDIARLTRIQACLAAGEASQAKAIARTFVESTATSAWLRRRARLVTETETTLSALSGKAAIEHAPVAAQLFTASVALKCDADRVVTGLGPGAARVGFRFAEDEVPDTWTFLDLVLDRDESRTVVVPGRAPSEPGRHVAELVVWRPGSTPRVLDRVSDLVIRRDER